MKKILSLLLSFSIIFSTFGCGKIETPLPQENKNEEDIGMTIQEAITNKDFIGPDNVSAIKKNIFIGIKSSTKVFSTDEDIIYYIATSSELKEEMQVSITLKSEFFSYTKTQNHTLFVTKKKQSVLGKIKCAAKGIIQFNVCIKDSKANIVLDAAKNIAVMDKAEKISDDNFMWGVQPFAIRSLEYNEGTNGDHCFLGKTPDETYDIVLDYISMTGANVIRDGTVWTSNNPSGGIYNFSLMSKFAKDVTDRGYQLNWHLGGTPDWAVADRFKNDPVKWNKPPTLTAWESYVSKVAELYGDNENIIMEIINECNWPDFFFGTAAEYISILNKSMEVLKNKNPKQTVINGGMVMPQANNFTNEASEKFEFKEDPLYYAEYAKQINSGKMPYVAYHSHQYFKAFVEKDAVNLMYYLKDNGMDYTQSFLNESGMFNADGLKQADDIIKKALWSKCNDTEGFVLFNFRDIEGGILSPPGWGIITRDGQPKESYVAYTNAIQKLSGYTSKKIYANTLYNAYLMEKSDKNTLVLFRESSVPDCKITLPQGVKYTAFDMFGNKITENTETLGKFPIYLEFENAVDANAISLNLPSGYKKFVTDYDRINNFPD